MAREGTDCPFEHADERIREADLAILNLECGLSSDGTPIRKRFSVKADPQAAGGLSRAGFGAAALANNHSVDCGRWELPETLEALRSRNLVPVGAGMTLAEAGAPAILARNGMRIAVLARTFVLPDGIIYREDLPTIASYDPGRLEEEIRAAEEQADAVIVSLHWGGEYARQPQESQRRIARRLVDAGAALVIGHHTHTPQPVERYAGGLIAYSLGNVVFDSAGEGGRSGTALRCTLTSEGVRDYEAIPVRIERGQPVPAPR